MTIRACVEGVDENGGRKEEEAEVEAEVEAQQQNWGGSEGWLVSVRVVIFLGGGFKDPCRLFFFSFFLFFLSFSSL